jgi:hypothetical protein
MTAPLKALGLLLLAGQLSACDGKLDPLEQLAKEPSRPPAVPGVHVVEPFAYHYPDEVFFDSIADTLQLEVALGQTEAAAFVYVPEVDGELRLQQSDLRSATGANLPASAISVGVLTFADRKRNTGGIDGADRLKMAYMSGARRGGADGDFRGFHQDAREHLPVVPLVIAPDAIQLSERESQADDFISLTAIAGARAWGVAGQGTEFWVTVNVPPELDVPAGRTLFQGTVHLSTPAAELDLPLAVEVLGFKLDTLEEHQRYVGVTDGLARNLPEFRGAIIADLRSHGCNALRDEFRTSTEYAELTDAGLSLLINTSPDFPKGEIPGLAALSSRALFNVGLFEPTPEDLASALILGQTLRAAGAELESEMTLDVARKANASLPFSAWTYALTTYELSTLHEAEFDDFLALLDAIRTDPANKEVPLSGHYAEVFNGHVPHQARLMYGLWLAQSNLDFGLAYGYAMVDGQNPFTATDYSGVAFPAKLHSGGETPLRVMLPTLTWEAFRAGIDDFRYVLTARRLTERNPALGAKLDVLLQPYGPLYSGGDRVDYRHREGDVRLTRAALAQLILEAL